MSYIYGFFLLSPQNCNPSRIQRLLTCPLAPFAFTQHLSSSPLPLNPHRYSSNNINLLDSFNLESFYTSLLSISTSNRQLNQIHAQLFLSGLQANGFIITKLINVCGDLGEIRYARQVFNDFPDPYVHLWNAIIRVYFRHNLFSEAIEMYWRMQVCGVRPDCFTLPPVLKACSGFVAIEAGRVVHGQVFRHGFGSDMFLQNGLVDLYAKCGQIARARVIFDGLYDKTIVSWTSIISGYAQNGQPVEALTIFSEMRKLEVKSDWIALVSILRAYTDIEDLEQGKSIHGCVIKMGLEFEPDLCIELTAMYAKCGQVMVARLLFDQMEVPNVILWNAMISGYAKNGCAEEAVELFRRMMSKNIRPNLITVISTILACAQVGSLEQARWMDNYVNNTSYRDDVYVSAALIDMYAKCGSVELARKVFNQTRDRDVVVWSAMIVGYGLHGCGEEAIDLFHKLKLSNLYASAHMWNGVAKVRVLMRERGLSKDTGYSMVEVNGKLQAFRMGDKSHPRAKEINEELEKLERRIKEARFVPDTESVLHDLNNEDKEESLCNYSERLAIAYSLISTPSGTTLRITKNLRACVNCHSATEALPSLVNLKNLNLQGNSVAEKDRLAKKVHLLGLLFLRMLQPLCLILEL
ncbi:hypothetical protein RHMOL_Rhmol05G0317300 [Rhododendron molle]|uniref:Uncharacterized protein n=1 Tax=Rhododendron molle TaxID=49168 RepID=A0ACC0NWQ5_RHOML|nr:hypothetical protein RHMOL_Rhmol05G0317300 [Rhododendron molle]